MNATNPIDVLGPALLAAVREVFRLELAAVKDQAETAPELLSPRQASEHLGGRPSADTISAWVRTGRLPRRVNNLGKNPRRPNYLVRLDEVRAVMEAPAGEGESPPSLDEARARARTKAATRRA